MVTLTSETIYNIYKDNMTGILISEVYIICDFRSGSHLAAARLNLQTSNTQNKRDHSMWMTRLTGQSELRSDLVASDLAARLARVGLTPTVMLAPPLKPCS